VTRRGLARAAAAAAWASALAAAPGSAQVTVTPPSGDAIRGDTLTTVTPTFLIQAVNIGPARPLFVTLQIATNSELRPPFVLDTLLVTSDSTITVTPTHALGSGTQIWWRARVVDAAGAARLSAIGGPLTVPPWVTPVSPPAVIGQPVRTRVPRFVWRSPDVGEPPGPWEYEIEITNLGDRFLFQRTRDTVYVVPEQARLEANASYRWTIRAFLPRSGQSIVVPHPAAFFVEDPTVVTSTILYQNFPNPFPSTFTTSTCVWFDLGAPARVELDIYDLRGLRVRRLLPSDKYPGQLPAGRYGRSASESNEGCDRDFEWDGVATDGRIVPAGLYFLRFRADGVEHVKKVLFRGR
jgi:hypothetical protein